MSSLSVASRISRLPKILPTIRGWKIKERADVYTHVTDQHRRQLGRATKYT